MLFYLLLHKILPMTNNPTPNNRYRVNKANHMEILDMTHDGNNVDETRIVLNNIFNDNGFFHLTN